ncbi:transglutaminase-like domain-containing protein [Robertkochia aurantiaca]|uniref:transglutaminase-like domain-containing protein n=1 Tax=Robertkochia aurantiaca TaxID=2873700 RepID=UPI001CCA631F|nr:transglutaminase-like domain-containing protein [Robertkochia sp. 3YJGBD-33]
MKHKKYTEETWFLNYNHPAVRKLTTGIGYDDVNKQVEEVYLRVRDGWRYNPYRLHFKNESYRAGALAERKEGHCIDKAILFVAGLRSLGIPARLHLAKVGNHIAVDRLIEKLGKNELAPHGMADVFVNGKWVKASPAFNRELCEKFDVDVLDFDGSKDSVMQQYNRQGKQFMTYLEDYGHFEDVPYDFIIDTFRSNYPDLYELFKHSDEVVL